MSYRNQCASKRHRQRWRQAKRERTYPYRWSIDRLEYVPWWSAS